MVRFAAQLWRGGHLPLTSWFPFLGLGSPQFLHYQSLPAMVTGLLGIAAGPDAAFRWTLYVLLSVWPLSVYLSARLFGAGRWAGAASAAMSPFLVSRTGVGYEQHAYLWKGFGLWTQLWASLTLPLAWGTSWKAIRTGRGIIGAVALVSVTIALHFETGYLALVPLVLWPLVAGVPVSSGVKRAAAVVAGSLLAAAWVIVPLIAQRGWAARNEILDGTPLVNGYGAGRVLGWLASGQLLDHGRIPIVTAFAAVGLALACARCRSDADARALLVVLGACLMLSFGRTTLGALADVIPGSGDIFFRRFMMGVQLAALLLAGLGAAWSARAAWSSLSRLPSGPGLRLTDRRWGGAGVLGTVGTLRAAVAVAAIVAVLAPAWLQLGAYDRRNATSIAAQRRADMTQGAQLDRLIAVIDDAGGGRVYAGMPSNWGMDFTVGAVPVFKYLESRDVDEVGYTLRTAALMTGPEYHFDDSNPADYRLFGIRYLILPSGYLPPVPARLVMRAGAFSLWTIPANGYVYVGTIVGELVAGRTDVGARTIPLLRSRLPQADDYLRVAFGGARAGTRALPPPSSARPAGTVLSQADELDRGELTATVRMRRPGVAVLSVSFDPGWTVTLDGRPADTFVVAPALLGTDVPPGTHVIAFRYRGYGGYLGLFVLWGLVLAAGVAVTAAGRRRGLAQAVASKPF